MSGPRQAQQIQFRAGALLEALAARSDNGTAPALSEIARRDLARYYAVLDSELASVALAEPEAALLCDALNGTRIDERSYRLLWAEIDEACAMDQLDAKWSVPRERIVATIRSWSPAQTLAVVDAVERFWQPGSIADTNARLREVGLVGAPRRRLDQAADVYLLWRGDTLVETFSNPRAAEDLRDIQCAGHEPLLEEEAAILARDGRLDDPSLYRIERRTVYVTVAGGL